VPVLRDGTPLKRGTFVVASLLGRGGFGEVYLARQPRMNRDVAIKVLNPNLSDDPDVVERFQREALAAAALRHPHVLPVYDFDFDEDAAVWFLAMQYVPGGRTLKDRMGAPIDPAETMRLLLGVAGALDAAHARSIVHRDVKPANVLIDGDHAALADFGIAHLGDMTGITQTGMAVGTPVYMSPEQAMDRPVGPAADQYSLAVMAFEMLTGRPPFLGDSLALVMQHVNSPAPGVSQFNATVPLATAAAVARALSKEPAERFPTCTAFVQALMPGATIPGVPGGTPVPSSDAVTAARPAIAIDSMGMEPDRSGGMNAADYFSQATAPAPDDDATPIETPAATRYQAEAVPEATPGDVKAPRPLPIPMLAGGAVVLLVGAMAAIFAIRSASGGGIGGGPGGNGGGQNGIGVVTHPIVTAPTATPNTYYPVVGQPSPRRPTGLVNIDSNPTGAVIFVDGQPQTLTPRGFNLEPGEYEIKLQMQSYEDYVGKVEVTEGQTRNISWALKPLPAIDVLDVASTAIGREPYKDSYSVVRIGTPTNTFRIQDDVNAVAYVRPRSKGIRELPFTMAVRWQTASGTPIEKSVSYRITKDAEEEFLHVCAPASVLDPQASNRPLGVEILADGERVAWFEFRVSGGSVNARPPSPCDETTIRGPTADAPGQSARVPLG
jgi:serine/threonine-protein kinase